MKTTLRAVELTLWALAFLVWACNGNDDTSGESGCGSNNDCPAGYICSATGLCVLVDARPAVNDAPLSTVDAPLAANDAPLAANDAPLAANDAPLAVNDASLAVVDAPLVLPDSGPADARLVDGPPPPDAPPPCSVAQCDPVATCDDSTGVAVCTCAKGYEDKNGDGHVCALIDLCRQAVYPCGPNTVCTPKPTTFTCACAAGYAGAPDDMFKGCSDVNECAAAVAVCAAHSTCANLPGTFHCVCDPGFSDYVPGVGCSAPVCGSKGTCDDSQTCSGGTCMCLQPACAYASKDNAWCDGTPVAGCIDNNECNHGACAPHGSCVNVVGSFGCRCDRGYVQSGADCVDIDECTVHNGGCSANATCTNTDGSRTCACNAGFSGDGFTCTKQ